MNESRLNLLSSELYTSSSYIDRVLHAILNVSGLKILPSNQKICGKFNLELNSFLKDNILHPRLTGPVEFDDFPEKTSPDKMKLEVAAMTAIFDTLILLKRDPDQIITVTTEYINILYKFSRLLHQNCRAQGDIDVTFPRLGLAKMAHADGRLFEDGEALGKEVPLFTLQMDDFYDVTSGKNVSISAIDLKRDQKYEELLQKGHQAIFEKRPEKALKIFERAFDFKECAEILNLIGWCYSLIGNIEQAKSYCLKAIRKDKDYGPPYNDLGSYLMGEGNYNEALKWFELAKKARNYANREYPYINAGRVYVAKQRFEEAIIEFEQALVIAPFQEELENTIRELKIKLVKIKESQTDTIQHPIM